MFLSYRTDATLLAFRVEKWGRVEQDEVELFIRVTVHLSVNYLPD